ncbi:unnamed protein product [Trypanosoma congolense IL3000]|uniref:WGS project CAEQ00000000 data, annotated contig 1190 n=1 Tax=Trypanosoma congolense (strain IL3000) TaxID=1068625 RepID=F9W4J7_TRYCI|nr:unnamed protein product [Trypanosoma congolense IL3000]
MDGPAHDGLEYLGDEVVVIGLSGKKYRRSVCVFIMNENGEFLICRRRDNRQALQCVQGGAKFGETPQQTAAREVKEEIGIPTRYLTFVSEITWPESEIATSGDGSEPRAMFRYPSKSWRKIGISGQELYPLLYCANSSIVDLVNFRSVPSVRPEFCEAFWGPLHILSQYAPKSKIDAMTNACAAVEAYVSLHSPSVAFNANAIGSKAPRRVRRRRRKSQSTGVDE